MYGSIFLYSAGRASGTARKEGETRKEKSRKSGPSEAPGSTSEAAGRSWGTEKREQIPVCDSATGHHLVRGP